MEPILSRSVTTAELDLNGHMNAVHFFAAQVACVRTFLSDVGVSERYVDERRMGTFAVEHHLRYLGELREGETYSVRVRLLSRTGKALHAAAYLVNESARRLANVLEVIVVHVDQDTRRAIEIPEDLAAEFDRRIRAGEALGWTHDARLAFRA